MAAEPETQVTDSRRAALHRLRTRREHQAVRSRWLSPISPELRMRAERALLVEPHLAGELVRILGNDEELDKHFILGFTARPDPISPQQRLADGFAAMALRCEQIRAHTLLRRRFEFERSARRATERPPTEPTVKGSSKDGDDSRHATQCDRGVDPGAA